MVPVLRQAVRRRRTSLLWWSLGLAGVVGLLAVAYPTVRDNHELDKTFAGLPPGVQGLLGLGGQITLTSPVGYLNSQFFANLLPVMLLVFAVGVAPWAISGDEAAGTWSCCWPTRSAAPGSPPNAPAPWCCCSPPSPPSAPPP